MKVKVTFDKPKKLKALSPFERSVMAFARDTTDQYREDRLADIKGNKCES